MSPHLSSFHLFPSFLTCHLSKIVFISFESSTEKVHLNSSQLFCAPESFYCWKNPLHKQHCVQTAFAHRSFEKQIHLHKKYWQNTLYYKCCTSTHQYYFVLQQSLHKALPSTTLYSKLAQSKSQYYFTTFYYKACTKHIPILLYYFLLQSLHKAHPNTTLYSKLAQSKSQYYFTTFYYKACTKHIPILLYYFLLQSLHKAHPNTTLYYKPCTEHFPELLGTRLTDGRCFSAWFAYTGSLSLNWNSMVFRMRICQNQ